MFRVWSLGFNTVQGLGFRAICTTLSGGSLPLVLQLADTEAQTDAFDVLEAH